MISFKKFLLSTALILATTLPTLHAEAQSVPETVTVEWVYRVRYGGHDEWFDIFKKYQVAILEH